MKLKQILILAEGPCLAGVAKMGTPLPLDTWHYPNPFTEQLVDPINDYKFEYLGEEGGSWHILKYNSLFNLHIFFKLISNKFK